MSSPYGSLDHPRLSSSQRKNGNARAWSKIAGTESVERLIAAAGGSIGLVPSGTEPNLVKRSWNSEHGRQAERSICRRKPLDRASADTMSLCANATSEAQPAFGLSDPSSANPSIVRLIVAGSIPVPVITHQRERPLPLISQACRLACPDQNELIRSLVLAKISSHATSAIPIA